MTTPAEQAVIAAARYLIANADDIGRAEAPLVEALEALVAEESSAPKARTFLVTYNYRIGQLTGVGNTFANLPAGTPVTESTIMDWQAALEQRDRGVGVSSVAVLGFTELEG